MHQIEGIEEDVVGLLPQGRLQGLEVRSTVITLHNCLAIDNCRLTAEVGSSADDRGITVAPIISIACEDTRLPSLKQHLAAIAIMFDFVNPVLPLWRLIDRGSKLRLDEPEPRVKYARHGGRTQRLKKKPGRLMPGLLPLFQEERWRWQGNHHHRLTTTGRRLINPRKEAPA